jgi:hypothetical protein
VKSWPITKEKLSIDFRDTQAVVTSSLALAEAPGNIRLGKSESGLPWAYKPPTTECDSKHVLMPFSVAKRHASRPSPLNRSAPLADFK